MPQTQELAKRYATTAVAGQFDDPNLVATAFVPNDTVSCLHPHTLPGQAQPVCSPA